MVNYNDSEIDVFHPICEKALISALNHLNLNSKYRVIHHKHIGSLEPDFVVENIITSKILCVIEVKRTRSHLNSNRCQFQAMSYVQNNLNQSEKPYYILTNLERAILFRFDDSRLRPYQQIIEPGITEIIDFDKCSEEKDLINELSFYFERTIDRILEDKCEYFLTLEAFAEEIAILKEDPKRWKSNIAIMFYEYIRGVFENVGRIGDKGLSDIRIWKNDVKLICDEGVSVGFPEIFNYTPDTFNKAGSVDNTLLIDLFEYAKKEGTGEAIADTLYQVLSDEKHKGEGDIATDQELAKILAVLAHDVSGDLGKEYKICDPGAGSGNLISEGIKEYNISSSDQIIVNDCNPSYLEVLSLRLGLENSRQINKKNAPKVTCESIADLDRDYFSKVKVLLMNPPFVAGIKCAERKKPLYRSIKKITGEEPLTAKGQMDFESVFLELITDLLEDQTTVATVFPEGRLISRGPEAQITRKVILEKFGLRKIFTYPRSQVFEDVLKDTCILIGRINDPSETVDIIACLDDIPNVDIYKVKNALNSVELDKEFKSLIPGVQGRTVSRKKLNKEKDKGWRILNSYKIDALQFIETRLDPILYPIIDSNIRTKKGKIGAGGSNLFYLNKKSPLYSEFINKIDRSQLALRNARSLKVNIGTGDAVFLDFSLNSEEVINEAIKYYIKTFKPKTKQKTKPKSFEELKKLGSQKSTQEVFPENSVLLPRIIRKNGKVYYSPNKIHASSNFVALFPESKKQAILLTSWMTTIFYQLICEVQSKPESGPRKMEVGDTDATLIPDFDLVTDETYKQIEEEFNNIKFLKLVDPKIRKIDEIWASELFGEESYEILEEAQRKLKRLVNSRLQ